MRLEHPPAPLRVTPPLLREGERRGSEHPPAPLRVTPPLVPEGERTQWPGKAGSTGALSQFISRRRLRSPFVAFHGLFRSKSSKARAPRNRLCRAATRRPPGGVTPQAARGGAFCGR